MPLNFVCLRHDQAKCLRCGSNGQNSGPHGTTICSFFPMAFWFPCFHLFSSFSNIFSWLSLSKLCSKLSIDRYSYWHAAVLPGSVERAHTFSLRQAALSDPQLPGRNIQRDATRQTTPIEDIEVLTAVFPSSVMNAKGLRTKHSTQLTQCACTTLHNPYNRMCFQMNNSSAPHQRPTQCNSCAQTSLKPSGQMPSQPKTFWRFEKTKKYGKD